MRPSIDVDCVSKAIFGTTRRWSAIITSFHEQIEWHLRISSLLVGLLACVLSLVSMVYASWRI